MGLSPVKFLYPDNEERKLAGLRYDNSIINNKSLLFTSIPASYSIPYNSIKTISDLQHATFKSIFYRDDHLSKRFATKLDKIPVANTIIIDLETYNLIKCMVNYYDIKNILAFGVFEGNFYPYSYCSFDHKDISHILIAEENTEKIKQIKNVIDNGLPNSSENEYELVTPLINFTIINKIEHTSLILPVATVVSDLKLKTMMYNYNKTKGGGYFTMLIVKEINGYMYKKDTLIIDPTAEEYLYIHYIQYNYYEKFMENFAYLYQDEINKQVIKSTIVESEPQPSAPKLTELEGH